MIKSKKNEVKRNKKEKKQQKKEIMKSIFNIKRQIKPKKVYII